MQHNTLFQLAALAAVLSVNGPTKAQLPDSGIIDIAGPVGIAETTVAYHVSVADYDNNGFQDFLFNRRWALPLRLYRNVGGVFQEDLRTDFKKRDRLDCEWGDPNVDGRPDFYCSVGAKYGTVVKANQLWIQRADGTFLEQAAAWNVTDPYGRGRQVAWFNFNGDQFPDLFVGNDFPRTDGVPSPNRVFVNEGGVRFREAVIPGVTAEIGARCASAADVDRDGYDDLLVCGNNGLRFYRNINGTGFMDMVPGLGLSGYVAYDAIAADLTGDGWHDLVLTIGGGARIYAWTGGWTLAEIQFVQGKGLKNMAATDMDGDLDLDIYTVVTGQSPNPPDLLLRNRGTGIFDVATVGASTTEGIGGRCAAIDHDNDGRFGVLVVNSDANADSPPGPLQLMVQNQNLLANPGFETGRLDAWDNWRGLSISASNVHSGSWAATVTGSGGGKQDVPAWPNVKYTLTVFGKVDASQWAAASYKFFDALGRKIGEKNLEAFGTTYAQRSATFTTPLNTVTIRVAIWNNSGGKLYVDDFALSSF